MFKLRYARSQTGFTLVELMLVVGIIALMAALAIPSYLRARKRSQATHILDDLRAIDNAMDLFAVEFNKAGHEVLTPADVLFLKRYLKERIVLYESMPNDMFGNAFVIGDLQTPPQVAPATFAALSDVAPAEFWAPYDPGP
jgi:prepilin-type N-terminal cleavage/methylation domain-containing protein